MGKITEVIDRLEKGKKLPVGTIREWGGVRHVKTENGWTTQGKNSPPQPKTKPGVPSKEEIAQEKKDEQAEAPGKKDPGTHWNNINEALYPSVFRTPRIMMKIMQAIPQEKRKNNNITAQDVSTAVTKVGYGPKIALKAMMAASKKIKSMNKSIDDYVVDHFDKTDKKFNLR